MANLVECHFCMAQVRNRSSDRQMDHFPIPKRNGGTTVVAACLMCHDLKDRTPLVQWPLPFLERALGHPIWALSFARTAEGPALMTTPGQAEGYLRVVVQISDEVLDEVWPDLPWESRVLFGKLRAIASDVVAKDLKELL